MPAFLIRRVNTYLDGDDDAQPLSYDVRGFCRFHGAFARIGGERRLRPRPARLQCVRGVPFPGTQSQYDGAEPGAALESQGWRIAELRALLGRSEIVRHCLGRQDAGPMAHRFAASHPRQRDDLCGHQEPAATRGPAGVPQGGNTAGVGSISSARRPNGRRRERNLRLKTDSSGNGPQKGAPALIGAGMLGDRADIIFAAPEEISGSIKPEC